MGWLSVKDFGDETYTSLVQVVEKGLDHCLGFLACLKGEMVDLEVGLDEGPNKPGPDGALVVGTVATEAISVAGAAVLVVFAVQTAQAEGG